MPTTFLIDPSRYGLSSGLLFYVDNAASGANNGTSWANAWQSFAAISWGSVVPGSTIYISGGTTSKTYAGPGMVVGAAGTLGNPITITRGIDSGHNGIPILDGQNTGSRWYGIDNGWSGAAPKNYVTVSRLSLRNFESAGLHARNTTAGVVFEDNDVLCGSSTADDPRGIDVRLNTGIIVRNNRVTTPASAAGETDGLFSASNQDFLYEDNQITISNTDDSGHSDSFQIDGDGNGIVRNNIFIGAPAGTNNHVVWMHAIQTGAILQFYNNVCVSRGTQHNVTYWRELAGSGNGTVLLYNNTIYHGLRAVNLERVTLVEIKNNIIWPDDLGVGVRSSLNDLAVGNVSHNLVWVPNANAANTVANGNRSYTQWTATDGYNASGVNADPLFVNAAGEDFTLQNGSPAIDAGTTLATVTTDLTGATRPQGAAYDIGAYDRAAWTPWSDLLSDGAGGVVSAVYQDYVARMDEDDVLQWRFGPGYSNFHPIAESIATMDQPLSIDANGVDGSGNHTTADGIEPWFDHVELGGQLCYLPDSGADAGLALAIPAVLYRDPEVSPANHPGVFDYRVHFDSGDFTPIVTQSNPDKAIVEGGWDAIQGSTARIPISAARARGEWPMAGIVAFKGGLIGVGECGNGPNWSTGAGFLGFPAVKLGATKVPTACAMTLNREFALVTCWDTATETGHLAVLAVEGNPIGDSFGSHFLGTSFFWGLPNWAGLRAMKLLGYIDLPFKAPMMVEATSDLHMIGGRGYEEYSDNIGLSLATQLERDWWHQESGKAHKRAARAGYAVVASRTEGKVCFIDLQPLFSYYRTMYFTSGANYTATQDVGLAADEWPHAFSFASAQTPTIVATLDIAEPTSVLAGFSQIKGEIVWSAAANMETGNTSQLIDVVGAAAASTLFPQKGTHAFRTNPTTTAIAYGAIQLPAASAVRPIRVVFGFRATTLPSAGTVLFSELFGTGSIEAIKLRIASTGIVTLTDRANTVRGTGTHAVTAGSYHNIEYVYTPSGGNAVAVQLRINGVLDIDASWAETPASLREVYFGAIAKSASTSVDFHFDNMVAESEDPWPWTDEPYKHRCYIGTMHDGIRIYDVGNLVEQDAGAKDTPTEVDDIAVGPNVTSMTSTYYGESSRAPMNVIFALSRGDNRITEFNGNTGNSISSFRDSRIVDPIGLTISNLYRGNDNIGFLAVHLLDYSSKSVSNYVTDIVYTAEDPTMDTNWYFGHATTIPGKPVAFSISEIP